MEINNKKNHLSHVRISFIMLLFAMCLTMNVFLGTTYNLYELLDTAAVVEREEISENIVINGDGDNTAYFKASFLNENNSYNETVTKNICPVLLIAAIPKGISQLLFLIIVFLLFLLTFFILLPDGWTLINQKVRLDN